MAGDHSSSLCGPLSRANDPKEREAEAKKLFFNDLALEVTYHHLSHTLLVILTNPATTWEEIATVVTQGMSELKKDKEGVCTGRMWRQRWKVGYIQGIRIN